jgi:hypothetical protein
MKRALWLCAAGVLALADTGTPTRSSPSDYSAHESVRYATIAANYLTTSQVTTVFSNTVSKNFAVVEIAVFPEPGRTFDLEALDFALKTEAGDRLYAVTPEEAAWHGKKPPSSSAPPSDATRGVNVITEAGVGYGTRTNPVTGKTDHEVVTFGGVGVDNRPAPPMPSQTSSADATYQLEGKLRGLELQEGQTTRPVSGYLYFPLSRKPKNGPLILEYSRSGERAALTLSVR